MACPSGSSFDLQADVQLLVLCLYCILRYIDRAEAIQAPAEQAHLMQHEAMFKHCSVLCSRCAYRACHGLPHSHASYACCFCCVLESRSMQWAHTCSGRQSPPHAQCCRARQRHMQERGGKHKQGTHLIERPGTWWMTQTPASRPMARLMTRTA